MREAFIKGSSALPPNSINIDLVGKRLGFTGFKRLPRETKLACYAIEEAFKNSEVPIPKKKCNKTAIIIATTFSNLNPILELYDDYLKFGVEKLNPAIFPNTVINSISGYASIVFHTTGPNITISQGKISGIKALEYSMDLLKNRVVENVVLCELNLQPPQLFHGLISQHVQSESIATLFLSTQPSKRTVTIEKSPEMINMDAEKKLNLSYSILELTDLLKQRNQIYLKKCSDTSFFLCEGGDDFA